MKVRKIDDEKLLEMIREGKQGKECAKHFGVSPAAISKRLKRLQPPPESLAALTPKERQFCIEMASGKTQTQAAMNSFDCASLHSAKVIGSQLRKKPEIEMAICEIMAEAGLSRRYRITKLKQHVDHADPVVSLRGLDMAFRLDGAYSPAKHLVGNFTLLTKLVQSVEPVKERTEDDNAD